jgi:hypothetical protein
VNPDFGQVEVDPAVVNLSDAEDVLSRRSAPFFTEGVSIFRCGNNGANSYSSFNWPEPTFFYSRRIGRSPRAARPDSVGRADDRTARGLLTTRNAVHISARRSHGPARAGLERGHGAVGHLARAGDAERGGRPLPVTVERWPITACGAPCTR